MATQLPNNGDVITFSKAPAGSYCRTGEAYRVERSIDRRTRKPSGDFRFVSVTRGSSTYDRPWAVKMAEWSAAA